MTDDSSFRQGNPENAQSQAAADDAASSEATDATPQGLTDDEKRQALGSTVQETPAPDDSGHLSEFHAKKLQSRRTEWQFDTPLFLKVAAIVAAVLLLLGGSYLWQSVRSSSTFVVRADAAEDAGDSVEESKWLKRYLMLNPNDDPFITRLGFVADRAVDEVAFEKRAGAIREARVRLTSAKVAATGDEATEVRWRLMERLLQHGGYYCREVERNLFELNPPEDSAEAHRLLALSLYGLIRDSLFKIRRPHPEEQEVNYWEQLSRQPVGVVLRTAVKFNPDDLAVVESYLNLAKFGPEYFVPKGELPKPVDLANDDVLQNAIQKIKQQGTSSAVVVAALYQQNIGQPEEAYRLIFEQAPKAIQQLDPYLSSKPALDASDEGQQALTFEQLEALQDDYRLVVQLGRLTTVQIQSATPPDDLQISDVQRWLDTVQELDLRRLRITKFEHRMPFLYSGLLAVQTNDPAKALEYWRRGLKETIKDDLLLYEQVVTQVVYGRPDNGISQEEAKQTLQDYAEAIDSSHRRILALTTERVSTQQRQQQLDGVETARWVASVARAKLLSDDEPGVADQQAIIDLLEPLLTANVKLADRTRRTGYLLLAAAYRALDEMDQVALVMNFALKDFPGDEAIIAESGDAWAAAGNLFRAYQQWNRAKFSDQFELRLRALQANVNYQRRLEPQLRDLGTLRSTIRDLQAEIKSDPTKYQTLGLRLKIIAAQIPTEGNAIEEHLVSKVMVENLRELSEQYVQDSVVQAFVAQRFAAANELELAQKALEQYSDLEAVTDLQKELLKAQITLAGGQIEDAVSILTKYAEENPEDGGVALLRAAEVAKQTEDRKFAYDTLEKIPADMRSPSIVYQAYQLALANEDQPAADRKLAELHQLESHTDANPGVYSLYVETRNIINELLSRPGEIERNDPALVKAKANVNELLDLRPYWGNVIALKGWIAYARPRYDEAIELLQRGIAAGDSQMRTRMLLLRALAMTRQGAKAEAELKKLSFITGVDLDPYDNVSIQVAFQDGRFDDALKMAEDLIAETPNDVTAYLVYANALTVQWKQFKAGQQKAGDAAAKEKIDQALLQIRSVLDKALKLAGTSEQRAAVVDVELRLAIEAGDIELVEKISSRIQSGKLSEADKLILKGKALLAKGDRDEALTTLLLANQKRPSPELAITLSELLRDREDADQRVAVLKAAVKRFPSNNRLRNQLARVLIETAQSEIDWEQISELLVEGDIPNLENQFSYAVMLASRGSSLQRRQAVDMLRELGNGNVSFSVLAKRTQAALMSELSLRDESLDDESRTGYQGEAQQLYIELCGMPKPSKADYVQYCKFLIALKGDDSLQEVDRLVTRLEQLPNSAIDVYQIQLARAYASGEASRFGAITKDWTKSRGANDQIKDPSAISVIAGAALMQNGEIEEGLKYYKKAYELSSERLTDYVLALSRDSRHGETAELCLRHYQKHGDVVSATLMTEALLALDADFMKREHSEVLSQAVKDYPENVVLLEAIGTLSMQRNDHQQAIGIYQQVVELEPRRVRALNNLAIALAETPGRERDGLQYVDQAIKLVGGNPELLDTRGTVLLRAKDYDLAIEAFSQAMELSKDPRFQFHKIQALVGKGDHNAAAKLWKSLDRENLNPRGLTANERESLEELAKRYDGSAAVQQ